MHEKLINGLKRRDSKALEMVVDEFGGLIYSIISRTLGSSGTKEDIEECFNDVLMAIWEHIDKYSGTGSLKSWIASIAKFKGIDYQRRILRIGLHDNIEGIELAQEDQVMKGVIASENQQMLLSMIAKLSKEDQEIFLRYYYLEESTEEIAGRFSLNRTAINNRLSKGRKKLKALILGEVKK